MASHDLQEPLRKVASFTAQLLQKRYGGQLDEGFAADQYIGFRRRRRQAHAAAHPGPSRVLEGPGRLGVETSEVDLGDVLGAGAGPDQLDRVHRRGGRRRPFPRPAARWCSARRRCWYRLFQNLVGNSLKFPFARTAPRCGSTSVCVAWRTPGSSRCRDNGIGIDEQYAERVFVIFDSGLHPKDVATRAPATSAWPSASGSSSSTAAGSGIDPAEPADQGEARSTLPAGPPAPTPSPTAPTRTRVPMRDAKVIDVLLVEDDPGDDADDPPRRSRTTRCATGSRWSPTVSPPSTSLHQDRRARGRPDAGPDPARPQPAADGRSRSARRRSRPTKRLARRSRSSC